MSRNAFIAIAAVCSMVGTLAFAEGESQEAGSPAAAVQATTSVVEKAVAVEKPASEAAGTVTEQKEEKIMPVQPVIKSVNPEVIIETSQGNILVELWPDKAPETVSNILTYVEAGFYNGLIFHRVINGFMIQGGGFDTNMTQKTTRPPICNEARTDTQNKRGTLAMARTSDINSGTAQFFINLVDNGFLDHRDNSAQGFGYCVFGRVIAGMDVVDRIGKTPTGRVRGMGDVPTKPILMQSVKVQRAPKTE